MCGNTRRTCPQNRALRWTCPQLAGDLSRGRQLHSRRVLNINRERESESGLCKRETPIQRPSGSGPLSARPLDAAFSSLFCFFALLLVCAALQMKLRSLRYQTPRVCRIAVLNTRWGWVLQIKFPCHTNHRPHLKIVTLWAGREFLIEEGLFHADSDPDSGPEVYCWRRRVFFWRMRATLGLACAQAAPLSLKSSANPGRAILPRAQLSQCSL